MTGLVPAKRQAPQSPTEEPPGLSPQDLANESPLKCCRLISVNFQWLAGYHMAAKPPAYVQSPFDFQKLAPDSGRYDIFTEERFNAVPHAMMSQLLLSNRDNPDTLCRDHDLVGQYLSCNMADVRNLFVSLEGVPDINAFAARTRALVAARNLPAEGPDWEQFLTSSVRRAWTLRPEAANAVFGRHNGCLLWAGMSLQSASYVTLADFLLVKLVNTMKQIPRCLPAKINQSCSLSIQLSIFPEDFAMGSFTPSAANMITLQKLATLLWVGEEYFAETATPFRRNRCGASLSLLKYSKLAEAVRADEDVASGSWKPPASPPADAFERWVQPIATEIRSAPVWAKAMRILWAAADLKEVVGLLSLGKDGENFETNYDEEWEEPQDLPEEAEDRALYDHYDSKAPRAQQQRKNRPIFDFSDVVSNARLASDRTNLVHTLPMSHSSQGPQKRKSTERPTQATTSTATAERPSRYPEAFAYHGMQSSLDARAVFYECMFWERVVQFAYESTEQQFLDLLLLLTTTQPTRQSLDFQSFCDSRIPFKDPSTCEIYPWTTRVAYYERRFTEMSFSSSNNACTGEVRGWGKQLLPEREIPMDSLDGYAEHEAIHNPVSFGQTIEEWLRNCGEPHDSTK